MITTRGHVQPERPERREHERQAQERETRQQPGQEEEVAGRNAPRLGREDEGREHPKLDEEGQQRPTEKSRAGDRCQVRRVDAWARWERNSLPAAVGPIPGECPSPKGRPCSTTRPASATAQSHEENHDALAASP